MLDTLPTLKETVKQYGLLAKKSLGQNFLLHMNSVRRVAKAAGDLQGKTVIEIGPGPGGLTRALLEAGAGHVIAIERDLRCLSALEDLCKASCGRLEVIHEDALKIKPQTLTRIPFKIIANLPYNIATELLIRWLDDLTNVQSLTLMFQKEVALRIVAKPNTKDYGRLSILCQYLTHPSKVFDLPPGAFTPAPKVTSSVIHLVPKDLSKKDLSLIPNLTQITRLAFGQRRKMLRSSLKPVFTEYDIFSQGIDPNLRPEQLSLHDFILLAKLLNLQELGNQKKDEKNSP